MQNQNFWNDSYLVSGNFENKIDDLGTNRDEFVGSFSLNTHSLPAETYNELFTDPPSSNICFANSISSVMDSPSVSTSTAGAEDGPNNKCDVMFPNASSFIGCTNSLSLDTKDTGEKHINLQNGQSHSDSGVAFQDPYNKDDLTSKSKGIRRRNSLPSNHHKYKRKLSIESEILPVYGTDVFEANSSNSSCDVIKSDSNEETSWSNCYSPYRKRPNSVVSSERGLDSLIDKLFSEDQKQRYLAVKKKKSQKMEARKENCKINIDAVYKSFVEGMAGSSQSNSVFDSGAITPKKDNFVAEADSKILLFESTEGCKINTTSTGIDINTKATQRTIFVTNSIPEETDIDLISDSESLTINPDSNQLNVMAMDCDSVNERVMPESILVSEVLFKNIPFENINQNISLQTRTDSSPFYDPVDIKGDTNRSAENLTNDEISDSLEKIFTETTESNNVDELYTVRQEQADEVPFDFETEKLISLSKNISADASDDINTVEATQGNFKSEINNKDSAQTVPSRDNQDFEGEKNVCVFTEDPKSVQEKCYLENKVGSLNTVNFLKTSEDLLHVEERQIHLNFPMESCEEDIQIESKIEEDLLHPSGSYSKCEIKSLNVSSSYVEDGEMELHQEGDKAFIVPVGDSEDHSDVFLKNVEVVEENSDFLVIQQSMLFQTNNLKYSNSSVMDSVSSEKYLEENKVNSLLLGSEPSKDLNSFVSSSDSENLQKEVYFDTNGKMLDPSSSETVKDESASDYVQIVVEDKNGTFSMDKRSLNASSKIVNSVEISYFKGQNEALMITSSLLSGSVLNNKSKARKSFTAKPSTIKPSKDSLVVIENGNMDTNEKTFTVEDCDSHTSCATQDNYLQNELNLNCTLPKSEVECIPISNLNAAELDITSFQSSPILQIKPSQKSRKSFLKRPLINERSNKGTAKKSFPSSCSNSSDDSNSNNSSNSCDRQNSQYSSSSNHESDDKLSGSRNTIQYLSDNNEKFIESSNQSDSLVKTGKFSKSSTDYEKKKQRSALKTFKKPFTVAKKSVTEKTAFKTVIQSYFGIRTAMKTCSKPSNQIVQSINLVESSSSEEVSADETKNSPIDWSPLQEFKSKPVCCCAADEVPCLCNNVQLQLTCEAEDTIDGNNLLCTRQVSQQYLLTPSSEIKHRAFCDIHLWRLKKHHCCPSCGFFCTQGSFLCCYYENATTGNEENHFFHSKCFLIPDAGLPPGCPHCCTFSDFRNVNLSFVEDAAESIADQAVDMCSEKQNLTKDLENYTILMETQNVEQETPSNANSGSVPEKQDLKTMLMAIDKEKSLSLRPAGKCLFNPIKTGDVKKVLRLIANGVDPNYKFTTHKNNTPLHIAAFYGFTGIVQVLLQYGALIDAVNDDLETSLILAVEKEQVAVVRYLIHAGAQVDVKNEDGLTALHVACKNNSKEVAELLYNTGKFDINLQDDGGWTPLVWSCEHNYFELVQWLLNIGADPNVRDNEENTALHWAACSGNSKILEMLIDNGCNLSFVNQRGDSALHVAARKDNYACVKLLLERNTSIDCINRDGDTPAMCCDSDSISLRMLNIHALSSTALVNISLQQHVVFRDISRGSERYPIQAVNEVDQEEFIMDFRYITRNCYAPDITVIATVDSMQHCYCRDNCSSFDCTCAHIAKCWYDMEGHLLSDFNMCDPPSIYECNKTCHCPKTCINRVVQKGLRHPLQLFRTLNQGWGVRTLKGLSKGTFVCEYIGEIISDDEANQRTDDSYFFDLESTTDGYCIDGRFFANVARFINHSCDPNLVSIRVFIEHQDLNFPRIAFFTMKDIEPFEELCFDYGIEFWVAKSQTILCTCNSSLCKYSKDSIDGTLQAYVRGKEAQMLASEDT